MLINGDIEAIIQRGEERTAELNSKYEGLNLEDLSNFKTDSSLQQWEGEDFRGGRKSLNLNMLSLSKRERKLNYSVDSYFKDTLRAGPSKTEKAPKLPRAPKQIQMCVHSSYRREPSRADDIVTRFAVKTSNSLTQLWLSFRRENWPCSKYVYRFL